MHLRFSFFRIWAITIRSRENHVFPRLCPRITQQRKKENFWDFSQWIYRKYLLVQHSFRPIRDSHFYTLISIGCLYKILWPFITLHSINLLRWFLPQAFTCLNTIYGVNMGVIGRCTSSSRRSAHFPIGSNAKLSPHFLHPQELLSLCKTYTCVDMNKWNIMQAISALAFIPFGSYKRTNLCLQKIWRPTVPLLCKYPDIGLCMHVGILMNFMRAKFQMAT